MTDIFVCVQCKDGEQFLRVQDIVAIRNHNPRTVKEKLWTTVHMRDGSIFESAEEARVLMQRICDDSYALRS